ncbi:hypothetical protein EJA72_10635 [Pseudomonas sp. PB120]|uniref:hypothetical protein n=1 Tax=Pseudomonas sp. PB120 TaxID=2494700 RepID=UPI0012FD0D46|nr:hypothetical protein [Pseudomonas sp. PB120]MVV48694.1 hypothetical protein [Pseudomonas sp. PB120]
MKELDLNSSAMGRRGFLQAFTLLSIGGLAFGFSSVLARPAAAAKTEFVVINGWVLPARHFRHPQA